MPVRHLKIRHLGWWLFFLSSLLGVTLIFVLSGFLEKILFAGSHFSTLKYLYIMRGASASFVVMMLAIFFMRIQHRRVDNQLQKFLCIIEQSPSSILITDESANIEYTNPRFTRMTGYTPEEVLGKNPRILQSGKTPRETYKKMWEMLHAGQEWHGEFLNRKKDGEIYWEAASISPIIDENNQKIYIGILEDISTRKKMEKLKEEFAGIVSHELRTPLAVLKMAVENLRDGLSGSLTEKQFTIVEIMDRNCQRLQRIVEDVLDLSRLESGKAKIHRTSVDLIKIFEETIGAFQKIFPEKNITLSEEVPLELLLSTDPDLVLQILNNLLDNATRFAKKQISVRVILQPDLVEIIVDDDGIGISKEDQRKLFSKFEQVHRSSGRSQYKGTGLGLVVSREIVHQLGGRIWVESVEGEGAKFHFTLPLSSQEDRKGREEEHASQNHSYH